MSVFLSHFLFRFTLIFPLSSDLLIRSAPFLPCFSFSSLFPASLAVTREHTYKQTHSPMYRSCSLNFSFFRLFSCPLFHGFLCALAHHTHTYTHAYAPPFTLTLLNTHLPFSSSRSYLLLCLDMLAMIIEHYWPISHQVFATVPLPVSLPSPVSSLTPIHTLVCPHYVNLLPVFQLRFLFQCVVSLSRSPSLFSASFLNSRSCFRPIITKSQPECRTARPIRVHTRRRRLCVN